MRPEPTEYDRLMTNASTQTTTTPLVHPVPRTSQLGGKWTNPTSLLCFSLALSSLGDVKTLLVKWNASCLLWDCPKTSKSLSIQSTACLILLNPMPAYNDGREYFPQAEAKNDLHLVLMSQTKVKLKVWRTPFTSSSNLMHFLSCWLRASSWSPDLPVALTACVSFPQVVSVHSPPAALCQTEAVPLHLDSVWRSQLSPLSGQLAQQDGRQAGESCVSFNSVVCPAWGATLKARCRFSRRTLVSMRWRVC